MLWIVGLSLTQINHAAMALSPLVIDSSQLTAPSLCLIQKYMHVLVMALVPHREMTEKQNTLQTLIGAVTSFFWNAPLRASNALKLNASIIQRKHLESTCPHAFLPVSKQQLHDEFSQTRRDSQLLERLFFYLGSAFQLIHGRVVGRLAGGTLGGADEFSQSLRHIPHRIYQHHLRRERAAINGAQWSEHRFICRALGRGFNTGGLIPPT